MRTIALPLIFLAASAQAAADYAAWAKRNKDGSWTAAAEQAVAASGLVGSVPSDIEKFCPAYSSGSPEDRKTFWVGLISIIARPESNFKPDTKFVESFADGKGENVVSRGLLQISFESANQKKYRCGIIKPEDLHDPAVNIACGVRILDAWIKTDGVIASYGNGPARGGARYWSTLRDKNKHLPELTGFTRNLPACRTGGPIGSLR